jgi:CheY-like chemotaxis protein
MALTALIVGTDPEAVQVLRSILMERGVGVEQCKDFAIAEARVAERRYGALIVDCEDEARAVELISAARNAPVNEKTLVVAMVDARNEARDLFTDGANFLLYKPVSLERAAESLQAAWTLMPRDRRRKRRVHVSTQASITFATTEDAAAPLLNLSEDGVALHSPSKIPPSRVYFQFALPGQSSTVRLSGDVAWQDSHGRVGLHFAQVPKASRRILDNWLQANSTVEPEQGDPTTLVLQTRIELDELKSYQSGGSSSAKTERRTQSRFNCRMGVNVSGPGGGVLQHCTLTDLSAGGAYVETTQPFPDGAAVLIEMRTLEMKLAVHGKVKSSHRGYGMGVEFSAKSPEERQQVKKLLAVHESRLEIVEGHFAGK